MVDEIVVEVPAAITLDLVNGQGPAGPQGIPGVAAVDTLADVTPSGIDVVFVYSVRDFFTYNATSARTVDGIEVLNGPEGGGRYERLNVPHPSWAYEPAYYVDPSTGNDENLGTSAEAPVQHVAELIRRLGSVYTPKTDQIIYFLSDCAEDVSWCIRTSTGYLAFQGQQIVDATGVVTSFTNTNRATNTLPTVNIGLTPADHLMKLLRNDVNGGYAWSIEDAGGGVLRTTPWRAISEDFDPNSAQGGAATDPSVGHSVSAVHQTKLTGKWTIDITAGYRAAGTIGSFVTFNNFELTQTWDITAAGQVHFQRCAIPGEPRVYGGSLNFVSCLLNSSSHGTLLTGLMIPSSVALNACLVTQNLVINHPGGGSSDLQLASDTIVWGGRLRIDTGRVRIGSGGAAFFNVPANAVEVQYGGRLEVVGALWGNGSTGVGVRVRRGGVAWVPSSMPTLTGSAGDFLVGPNNTAFAFDPVTGEHLTPARACTWANLSASVDAGGFGGALFDPLTGCFIGSL